MSASLRLRFSIVAWVAGLLLPGWAALALAQAPAVSEAPAKPEASPAGAEAVPGAAGKPAVTPIREQTIYVPYDRLRQVFEKHGRGVFLPYEKFQELWQAAQDKTRPPADPKPPVPAIITESENEATVAKDVVEVTAVLTVELLADGWHTVPLALADAAISSATIDGKPARIVGPAEQGYRLLIHKPDKKPEQIQLNLKYARAITRMPGENSVSFQAPQAPVSRWKVRIPQAGVKVNIHPLIAATEVPANAPQAKPEPGKQAPAKERAKDKPAASPDETVVLAFVGFTPTVRIQWTPKAEGATGLTALASVQAQQQVWVNEGVTRTRTLLQYSISRAEMSQLAIEVPTDHKVVNVFDANVRQWSVKQAAGPAAAQQITAQLFEPAKGTQQVTIELEKFAGEKAAPAVRVPVVRALDVGRQQGVVVVQVGEGLRAEAAKTTGLLQVDAGELPSPLSQTHWSFSYRYATVPFDLELAVEKVLPEVVADTLVEAYLQPDRLSMDLLALLTVERAGVFRFDLEVPEGFEVRQVRGQALAGAQAVAVDNHHLEGDKRALLAVNLARKAAGRVALVVELHKDLREADLLTPTGKAARIPMPLPRMSPGSVQRATGRLVVYAPESLRVNPGKVDGARGVSFKEALEGVQSVRQQKPADSRPVLAFAYTQEPVSLELAAERRKPQVNVRQLLVARIEEGVVKYQATLFYDVLYSGVKSLRVDVPADVAAVLRNTTTGVREKVITPAPDDLAKDYVAWSLAGESELMGEGKIELNWEKPLQKLDVGKGVTLAVPRLVPQGADRAWGQIVVVKAETIEVQEAGEPKGLRPIDPQQDLMVKVSGAARALEFHDTWDLALTATRYQLAEVKRTSVERAVVRMVVTRAEQVPVQALYRMRSARQRLAVKLPEGAHFDTEPLRINGRPVTLESDAQGGFVVPLVSLNADEPFLLELRYIVPGDGRQLDLPIFPEDPAVQKVYVAAYVPEEWALVGSSGPWSEEFEWSQDQDMRWRPQPKISEEQLLAWVREGANLEGNPADTFPTDGELYLFSTLRPTAPPDGSLLLRLRDYRWLHALVLGLVVIGGLVLVTARLSARALAAGALLVVAVLLGVFWPTLALHVLDGLLVAAIAIVLVVWIVWYVVLTRPAIVARRQARNTALPLPVAEPLGGPIDLTRQPAASPASAVVEKPATAETPPQETPPPAEPQQPSEQSPDSAGEEGETRHG